MSNTRLIVYHKHPRSAKTLFLRVNGTVCLFEGLPDVSNVVEHPHDTQTPVAVELISPTEQRLGLPQGSLEIEPEFVAEIDTSESLIPTYLARLKGIDPPFDRVDPQNAQFIAITEARSLPPAELELLRQAYTFIME
jgi:hypothetical protein